MTCVITSWLTLDPAKDVELFYSVMPKEIWCCGKGTIIRMNGLTRIPKRIKAVLYSDGKVCDFFPQ